jgi:hypothetical protein
MQHSTSEYDDLARIRRARTREGSHPGTAASRHRRHPPARCSCRVVAPIRHARVVDLIDFGVTRLREAPAEWSRQYAMLGWISKAKRGGRHRTNEYRIGFGSMDDDGDGSRADSLGTKGGPRLNYYCRSLAALHSPAAHRRERRPVIDALAAAFPSLRPLSQCCGGWLQTDPWRWKGRQVFDLAALLVAGTRNHLNLLFDALRLEA